MSDEQNKPEWLEAMSVLSLQPGDIVVVKSRTLLSEDVRTKMVIALRGVIPEPTSIIVMEDGADIGVLRDVPQ